MDKNYTHITFVLDRSGSMNKVKKDTIGGFNNFISDQKKVKGMATFSLIQFDDRYEPNYTFEPIQSIPSLTEETFIPRGWTRLLDAVGRAIIDTGESLNKISEENKPGKIVFVIQTDGEENSSKEFNHQEIMSLIKQQQDKYNWEFVFLGAQIQAVTEARRWGIKGANTIHYANSAAGMNNVLKSVSSNLASYRSGTKMDMSFEDKDREIQAEVQKDAAVTQNYKPWYKKLVKK